MRIAGVTAGVVLALMGAPLAHAGGQATPLDDDILTTAAPVFSVELAPDDVNAWVEVTSEDGALVGTCTPAPVSCTLAAPLANGAYSWTLSFQNPFCDGYIGEICGLVEREAGPRRFSVAVPRVEPRTLVLGRSIGAAALGMSQDAIHSLYGEPLRTRPAGDVFAVEGGVLEVAYAAGRVSALATTSAYYRTAEGIGVGTRAPRGWARAGRELVRGRTRLVLAGTRVTRIIVSAARSRR